MNMLPWWHSQHNSNTQQWWQQTLSIWCLPLHVSVSRHSNLQQSSGHLDSMVLSPRRDWRNWPLIKMWELLLGKSQNKCSFALHMSSVIAHKLGLTSVVVMAWGLSSSAAAKWYKILTVSFQFLIWNQMQWHHTCLLGWTWFAVTNCFCTFKSNIKVWVHSRGGFWVHQGMDNFSPTFDHFLVFGMLLLPCSWADELLLCKTGFSLH